MRKPSPRRLVAASAALLLTATLVGTLPSGPGATAAPPDPLGPLFEPLPSLDLPEDARVRPEAFAAVEVDLAGLATRLSAAPTERAARRGASLVVVDVPTPSGGLERFAVTRTPVMEPALAAAHPEITTYAGSGIDDPRLSIALDLTPMGFHASVRQPGGHDSWLVDPVRNERGTVEHVSYAGEDLAEPEEPFNFRPPVVQAGRAERERDAARALPGGPVQLRSYRLALVTDPTYAAYFGTENVLAEKATLMNRVNQVYRDDLAIRMLLVEGTDALNLDTAAKATQPGGPCGANACYTPTQLEGCSSALLTRNTFVVGQLVGADRYDIGHIALGLNGGGIAGLGVVGEDRKASGCTGLPQPQGDFFAVDYVAHEMGHQFNGNHTFDGNQGNCSLTNRNPGTSVEPGSGSSVMAYAGICGRDDLQPHTDPYFSQRSLDEVDEHVTAAPLSYSERQTIAFRGFDTDGDVVNLAYRGRTTTIERGALTYNRLAVQQRIDALTGGESTTVTGYDGAGSPTDGGLTITWNDSTDHERIQVLSVQDAGGAPLSAALGVQVQGGPGTNQGATSPTGNAAPSVVAPADRSIPVRTPFTLTGSGSDADGDALVYLWEQNDEGVDQTEGTALFDPAKASGPLFRVFGTAADVSDEAALQTPSPGQNVAGSSPSRTFPDMAQILSGNTNAATGNCPAPPADPEAPVPAEVVECFSEFLPTAAYTGDPVLGGGGELNFRLTARDQRTGGGGTAHDDVVLTLVTGAGPFLVTSQGTAGAVRRTGSPETVTWAVNGTAAPGLAPNVSLTMSDDGGQTFPYVLAESTPNDGSHTITWPEVISNQVRLKISAVDNYFFDVNDADLSLTGPLTATVEPGTAATAAFSDSLDEPVTVTARSGEVDADQLVATVSGVAGLVATRTDATPDGVRPSVATFTLDGPVTQAPGDAVATVTVSEPQPAGVADQVTVPVTVRPEGAVLDYTGPTQVTTVQSADGVALSATVADVADGEPGDVRRSELTFVDRSTVPATELCTAPVVGTATQGTATCEATGLPVGQRTIGLVLDGAHARDAGADDETVTVAAADGTAPQTTITGGPAQGALLAARQVRVSYSSSEAGSTFVCRLDGREVDCDDAPLLLRGLASGEHTVSVAARDAAGNLDGTPAVRSFAVATDDRRLARSAGWDARLGRAFFDRTVLVSERRGLSASMRVAGATRLGVVLATGEGQGRLAVLVDGRRVGTVSAEGPARTRVVRTVVLDAPLSGTLTVRTLSGRTVRLDGLVAWGE